MRATSSTGSKPITDMNRNTRIFFVSRDGYVCYNGTVVMVAAEHGEHRFRLVGHCEPRGVIVAVSHPLIEPRSVHLVTTHDERMCRSVNPLVHRKVSAWVVGVEMVAFRRLVENCFDSTVGARTESVLHGSVGKATSRQDSNPLRGAVAPDQSTRTGYGSHRRLGCGDENRMKQGSVE